MQVFLNGRFLPEAQAVIPISDRGFLYGDGLFETIKISHGRPLWWERHMERFHRGVEFLKLALPWRSAKLREFAGRLIQENALPESVLRVTMTRGSGPRGYSAGEANSPTLAMTLQPLPVQSTSVRLAVASLRLLPNNPIADLKSVNKLTQILARAEAERLGADEALLLNSQGFIAECAASNIFWVENGHICTPPVAGGALAGVTRGVVLELCEVKRIPIQEKQVKPEELFEVDGVFVTNSVAGIIPVTGLDGRGLLQSALVREVQEEYRRILKEEAERG
jgi:branched-chain amino acid aminotransferase